MTAVLLKENVSKFFAVIIALSLFFTYGILTGYNPIIGFVLAAGVGFVLAYYYNPPVFAYLYIFTVSFAAFLNLPVTNGGFSSAIAVALPSFSLGIMGALFSRDRVLIDIFFDRIDQILPILFLSLMIISMMNSKAMGFSAKQIQQFIYLVIIYYFLHLTIRSRKNFRKAFLTVLIGGICVGLLGLIEVVLQTPIYFLLGKKSILGALVSDSLLNAKMGRINGLIGDAPFHGIYMTMIASVSLYFLFRSRRKIIRILFFLSFLLAVFNVLGTGSRGALLALMITVFIFWALAEIPHKTAIMAVTVSAGVILVATMVFLVPNLNVSRSFTFSKETSDTAEMRWKNIPVALKMFADHPIIGNGPDGFVINYTRYASGLSNLAFREKTLKTHNTPLQIIAEYGLIGITLFSLMIFMAILRMVTIIRRKRDRDDSMIAVALIAGISAYIFFMATSNTLLDKYFWLAITLAQIHYSVCNKTKEEMVL